MEDLGELETFGKWLLMYLFDVIHTTYKIVQQSNSQQFQISLKWQGCITKRHRIKHGRKWLMLT